MRLVVELTDRCNLRCGHCFDDRHAGTGDLPFELVQRVLHEAHDCGVAHLSFTGGEPTLHRRFQEIVRATAEAGCTFSFVTNGSTFPRIHSCVTAYRRSFTGVTFSLDGAREDTHDRLRGRGSFRDVMRAASVCVARRLPFTFNMVVTRQNRHEIGSVIGLAAALGSGGVRFGHLMPQSPDAAALELSWDEKREVEQEIRARRATAAIPVGMAAGHHWDSPFFPCGPLELEEFNVDCRGNVTLCCHLSGYGDRFGKRDHGGNLVTLTLAACLATLRSTVHGYLQAKRQRVERGELAGRDSWPCVYCVRHFDGFPGSRVIPLTAISPRR